MEATIKQNYLNNRDLLKEIHLSKNSYCSFQDPINDHQYDIIVGSVDEINTKTIEQARQNRATRILKEQGLKIPAEDIPTFDLVFRVMTWEHIPLLPPKPPKVAKVAVSGNTIDRFFEEVVNEDTSEDLDIEEIESDLPKDAVAKTKADRIRVNFPPFYHYRLGRRNKPVLVGKSHWKGDLETGEFCKTHGQMTETLALMLMKLAEKYALKSNWRSYSYREEMQGQAVLQLCQVALQFDESKSQNPFSFLTQVSHNSFLRILNIEKKNQNLRDDLLIQHNMNPSFSKTNRDAMSSTIDYD